jgi:uridine kinase
VWSFHTHRREGVRELTPTAVVICEGIHALHATPCEHLDVTVFVDAPRAVRWARWEAIERRGQRGMGVEAARVHFDTIAEPSFHRGADEFRRAAHVVVQNHGPGLAVTP